MCVGPGRLRADACERLSICQLCRRSSDGWFSVLGRNHRVQLDLALTIARQAVREPSDAARNIDRTSARRCHDCRTSVYVLHYGSWMRTPPHIFRSPFWPRLKPPRRAGSLHKHASPWVVWKFNPTKMLAYHRLEGWQADEESCLTPCAGPNAMQRTGDKTAGRA